MLNTCSIRDKAEQKVYSALGEHKKRKKENMGGLKIIGERRGYQFIALPCGALIARFYRLQAS